MSIKKFVAATIAAFSLFALVPAATSSAGGVAGPCGTITSISASNVTLSAGSGGYYATPLSLRGSVNNCSQYIQRYWLDFSEPARPVSGGLNGGTTVTCTTSALLFPTNYVSSGSSFSWSLSTNITKTAVTNPSSCVGTHTVKAVLKSRTDGRVLSTVYVTYSVVLK